jgi:hypothetical protein
MKIKCSCKTEFEFIYNKTISPGWIQNVVECPRCCAEYEIRIEVTKLEEI